MPLLYDDGAILFQMHQELLATLRKMYYTVQRVLQPCGKFLLCVTWYWQSSDEFLRGYLHLQIAHFFTGLSLTPFDPFLQYSAYKEAESQ